MGKLPIRASKQPTRLQHYLYVILREIFWKVTGYVSFDNYFSSGHIHFGKKVAIASGVKIISRNHDLYDVWKHTDFKDVYIGDYCWIGANAVVLPGVTLGPHTIVGAGSIVTKSFPEGYCVIVGNPARLIKKLDKEKCVENRSKTI